MHNETSRRCWTPAFQQYKNSMYLEDLIVEIRILWDILREDLHSNHSNELSPFSLMKNISWKSTIFNSESGRKNMLKCQCKMIFKKKNILLKLYAFSLVMVFLNRYTCIHCTYIAGFRRMFNFLLGLLSDVFHWEENIE